jgi:penicillin-binding protein 2
MSLDYERYLIFKRRALLLGTGKMVLFGALGVKLAQLQLVESEQYRLRAEDNRVSARLLSPPRGLLLDRNGKPLADNDPDYQLWVIPEQTADIAALLLQLAAFVPLSAAQQQVLLQQARTQPSFFPLLVANRLSFETISALELRLPEMPGISVETGSLRVYPLGEAASHVTGYVGKPTAIDVKREGSILRIPGVVIGKSGLERALETRLRGRHGQVRREVDSSGRVIRQLAEQKSLEGAAATLSLDAVLQQYAFERLGQESGSVVVLDIASGGILALVSAPTINPNQMVQGISREAWQLLNSDPRSRHVNKALSGLYPPGSTFKMVVALAGLKAGMIHPETRVFCPGRYRLGNRWFHCWKRGGHGSVNLQDAIFSSCDVYFYSLAHRLGGAPIMEMASTFGLGQTYALGLPEEKEGNLPSDAWKREHRGHAWHAGDSLNTGIGQGDILTTPLQMATMAARLASGRAVTPWLVKGDRPDVEQKAAQSLGLPEHDLWPVRQGMDAVVNSRFGTAKGSRLNIPGVTMAGKTGTVQVRLISTAERARGVRKNSDLPWKMRDHAMFVAYAPVDNPQYAIAVVIEHGSSGSETAAPIARDVLTVALGYPVR